MSHYQWLGGLVLAVTGLIALGHHSLRVGGRLPDALRNDTLSPRAELIVAIVPVVVGLPLLPLALNGG